MSGHPRAAARRWTLLFAAALTLPACSTQGLAFRLDQRLTFVAPPDRAVVQLPVTIEWTIEEFDPTTGTFAVLVDRRPQPPGEPLGWFARDDEGCHREDSCPDDEWFELRQIHTTTDTEFTIDQLRPLGERNRREIHEVTIVLLDRDGRRLGESAWSIEFELERADS